MNNKNIFLSAMAFVASSLNAPISDGEYILRGFQDDESFMDATPTQCTIGLMSGKKCTVSVNELKDAMRDTASLREFLARHMNHEKILKKIPVLLHEKAKVTYNNFNFVVTPDCHLSLVLHGSDFIVTTNDKYGHQHKDKNISFMKMEKIRIHIILTRDNVLNGCDSIPDGTYDLQDFLDTIEALCPSGPKRMMIAIREGNGWRGGYTVSLNGKNLGVLLAKEDKINVLEDLFKIFLPEESDDE